MNSENIHRIYIVAGILLLLTIGIIWTVYNFSDDENNSSQTNNDFNSLPEIPQDQDNNFTTKTDQIEAEKRKQRQKELKEAQQNQINLNIFDVDTSSDDQEETLTVPQEDNNLKVPEKKVLTPKPKRKLSANQPVHKKEPEPQQKTKEPEPLDDDLIFASKSFSSNNKSNNAKDQAKTNNTKNDIRFNIPAVIQDEVTITQGSRVTIRITEDTKINGKIVPKNTFLQPIARFTRNRIILTMPPIKCKDGSYLNKKTAAYDGTDEMLGLYSKELLENRAAQETADDALNEAANEVNNGLIRGAIKSFGNNKVRENSITLRSNHPIIIRPIL